MQAPDAESVATVVQMMLGELNGSHLGFTLSPTADGRAAKPTEPRDTTGHLGARFDFSFTGPGLKIRDILPKSPADKKRSRLAAGEVILKIDGADVVRDMDLTLVLNGPADREAILLVQGLDRKTREVSLRPISYPAAQAAALRGVAGAQSPTCPRRLQGEARLPSYQPDGHAELPQIRRRAGFGRGRQGRVGDRRAREPGRQHHGPSLDRP